MTTKKPAKKYEKAYIDYRTGEFTYEDIAKKYKVSKTTINTWRSRYWSKWDKDSQKQNPKAELSHGNSHSPVKMVTPSVLNDTKAIALKQVADTAPARICKEYCKDNLPTLTDKQQRFVEEYLIDLDKKNAAIRAGYGITHADNTGCNVYQHPAVNAHIQVAIAERRKRTGVNVDTTIREMARIAYANPAKVVADDGSILEDASEDDLRAIAGVKIKTTHNKDGSVSTEREIKFCDKNKALEMLARHQGMFVDKSLVVTANAGDLSQLPTDALEAELKKQLGLSQTINVTPSHTDTEDDE